jgi:hypothetical protein
LEAACDTGKAEIALKYFRTTLTSHRRYKEMATKKGVKKSEKKSEKKADAPVAAPEEKAAVAAPVAAPAKNTMTLENGESIMVRGPEKFRAAYQQGNVGWQDFLRPARLALNLAMYSAKVGCSDTLVERYKARAAAEMDKLTALRVRVPSDMVTQHAMLADVGEVPVGTPDYIIALRKLAGLVKSVELADQPAIMAEIVSAKTALNSTR